MSPQPQRMRMDKTVNGDNKRGSLTHVIVFELNMVVRDASGAICAMKSCGWSMCPDMPDSF